MQKNNLPGTCPPISQHSFSICYMKTDSNRDGQHIDHRGKSRRSLDLDNNDRTVSYQGSLLWPKVDLISTLT